MYKLWNQLSQIHLKKKRKNTFLHLCIRQRSNNFILEKHFGEKHSFNDKDPCMSGKRRIFACECKFPDLSPRQRTSYDINILCMSFCFRFKEFDLDENILQDNNHRGKRCQYSKYKVKNKKKHHTLLKQLLLKCGSRKTREFIHLAELLRLLQRKVSNVCHAECRQNGDPVTVTAKFKSSQTDVNKTFFFIFFSSFRPRMNL